MIRDHIQVITKLNDNADIQNLRDDLQRLKGGGSRTVNIPLNRLNKSQNRPGMRTGRSKATLVEGQNENMMSKISQANMKMSNLQRLKTEREQFILQGYDDSHPFIKQIDNAINQLEEVR